MEKIRARKRVFLIEDEKSLVEGLSSHLHGKGYVTEIAYNGLEALQKLPVVRPDLILLDLVLPEMSGIDFLKEVQKSGSEFTDIPVLVLTNLQGDEQNFEKLGLKIDGYFVKANTSFEELDRKLKEMLGE